MVSAKIPGAKIGIKKKAAHMVQRFANVLPTFCQRFANLHVHADLLICCFR